MSLSIHLSIHISPVSFKQALTFAVMPSEDGAAATEAKDFLEYVQDTFPNTASNWVGYDTESEFVDIMAQEDYSRDPMDDRPAFTAGIVFTSGSPAWEYTVRVDNMDSLRGKGGVPFFLYIRFWFRLQYFVKDCALRVHLV